MEFYSHIILVFSFMALNFYSFMVLNFYLMIFLFHYVAFSIVVDYQKL